MNSLHKSIAIVNASIKHRMQYCSVPYTKKTHDLIKLLYVNGYLDTYTINFNYIHIYLKTYKNNFVINGFFFYSKPSNIRTITINELRRDINKKNKIFIISTSYGICTSEQALYNHHGGMLLGEINK